MLLSILHTSSQMQRRLGLARKEGAIVCLKVAKGLPFLAGGGQVERRWGAIGVAGRRGAGHRAPGTGQAAGPPLLWTPLPLVPTPAPLRRWGPRFAAAARLRSWRNFLTAIPCWRNFLREIPWLGNGGPIRSAPLQVAAKGIRPQGSWLIAHAHGRAGLPGLQCGRRGAALYVAVQPPAGKRRRLARGSLRAVSMWSSPHSGFNSTK